MSFIPIGNDHWKRIIVLKEILDVTLSRVVSISLSHYLESLIAQYLIGLTKLFPESLKPKHHFLVHYPTIIRCMGPLWNLSTMRCENKNQDHKK